MSASLTLPAVLADLASDAEGSAEPGGEEKTGGILEALDRGPSPEQLGLLRVLAVLEWSDRPEVEEHLRRLAGGAPFASLTQAAEAAWQRR